MSIPDYMVVQRHPRPIGIAILSVLHILGGVLLAIAAVAFIVVFQSDPRLVEMLSKAGITMPLLAAGIIFLAVLGTASGIGMWVGPKMGLVSGNLLLCLFNRS
jgi:hypothetical protein